MQDETQKPGEFATSYRDVHTLLTYGPILLALPVTAITRRFGTTGENYFNALTLLALLIQVFVGGLAMCPQMFVLTGCCAVCLVGHKLYRKPDPHRHSHSAGRSRLAFLMGRNAYSAEAFFVLIPLGLYFFIAQCQPLGIYLMIAGMGTALQEGLIRQRQNAIDRATRDAWIEQQNSMIRLQEQRFNDP